MQVQTNNFKPELKDTPYANILQPDNMPKADNVGSYGAKFDKVGKSMGSMGAGIVPVYTKNGEAGQENALNALKDMAVLEKEEFGPAEFISMSLTGEDAAAIEDGNLLEEYTEDGLERAIERVKMQRRQNAEALESQVEGIREEMKRSEELDKRVEMALSMANRVSGLSNAAAANIIEKDMTLTPKTIDKSSGIKDSFSEPKSEEAFEEVKEQVVSILGGEDEGLAGAGAGDEAGAEAGEGVQGSEIGPVSDIDMAAARWLFDRDVPITGKNVDKYKKIEDLKNVDADTLKSRILDQIMEGVTPENADLTLESVEELERKISVLVNAEDSTIREAYPEKESFATAKVQIEEIRVMMSAKSLRMMDKLGVRIDIDNLSEMVENMRVAERNETAQMLSDGGMNPEMISEEKLDVAIGLMHAKSEIAAAPVELYGVTIKTVRTDTIVDMADKAVQMRNAYDAVGTQVRGDLGDSIKKAFGNMDGMLEEMNISLTEANKRAVRILAYNNMEINEDSIVRMKEYDAKVTGLIKNMTPKVVAGLIESGENPLEMSVDKLAQVVADIKAEVVEEDVPLRKFLWKLDQKGDITPEERSGMIGIYRLLDKVEKSDGAAIGRVIKENRELSLSSLLTAVRSSNAQGMDATVNDESPISEGGGYTNSITAQINVAFANVTALKENLSPAVLVGDEAGRSLDDVLSSNIEEVLDATANAPEAEVEEREYYNSLAQNLKKMAENADDNVVRFLNEMSLPDHLLNISLMNNVLANGGRANFDRFNENEAKELLDSLEDAESFEATADEIDEAQLARIEEEKQSPDISHERLVNLIHMAGSVSFYRGMRQHGTYSVPIVTSRGVTACNVTFVAGDDEKKGSVDIAVNSLKFGEFKASIKVTGNSISTYVTVDSKDTEEIKRIVEGFEREVREMGISVSQTNIVSGTRSPLSETGQVYKPDNRDLYRIAKLFIENVSKEDLGYED